MFKAEKKKKQMKKSSEKVKSLRVKRKFDVNRAQSYGGCGNEVGKALKVTVRSFKRSDVIPLTRSTKGHLCPCPSQGLY